MSRLVEPGAALEEAQRLARQIASAGPLAVRASRDIVLAARYQDEETLKRLSAEQLKGVLASDDTTEGLRSFIEKRPPQWKGR